MKIVIDWLEQYSDILETLGVVSIVVLTIGAVLSPKLVSMIPVDYFKRDGTEEDQTERKHPVYQFILKVVRNLVGLVVLLAGIAMLVLPGQGLVTILLGLTLLGFPGKYQLERLIVRQKGVLDGLNWMREKTGVAPLEV